MSALRAIMTSGVGMLSRATNQISMIAVTLVATRFLAPAQFGVFSLAAAAVTLIRTMLYVGAFEFLLKAPDLKRVSAACLVLNLALAVGLGVAIGGLAYLGEGALHSPGLFLLMVAMAPANLIAAFTAWQESQILRGRRLRAYYGVTAGVEILAGALAVGLLFAGWGVGALVAQTYARTLFLAAGYLLLARPTLGDPPSKGALREVAGWSIHRYGSVATGFASNYGADFALGAFLSPAATGLYRASSRITSAVADVFTQPASVISNAVFSRRAAKGEPSGALWPRILLVVSFLGWPALAGLAVVASDLTPLVLGPAWAQAGPVIAVLCLARAATLIGAVANPYIVANNRHRILLHSQIVSAVATVAGLAVVSRYGVLAAAGVIAAVQSAYFAWLAGFALKIDPASRAELAKSLLISAGAACATGAAAFAALHLTPAAPLVKLSASVACGLATWAFVGFFARRRVLDGLHATNLE